MSLALIFEAEFGTELRCTLDSRYLVVALLYICLACLVCLIHFICFVCLVWLVCLIRRKKNSP